MTRPHNAYIGSLSAGYEWQVEPHWDDLLGDATQGAAGAALTFAAYRDTPFKLASFRDSQADELHMRFQIGHGWDPDTSVKFHVHFVPLTDPGADQVAHFEGQYTWVILNDEIPANAGWTTFSTDHTISPGDVNRQTVMSCFTAAPPANATESAIMLVYLKRAGLDEADTYEGNLAVLSLDLHYQKIKIGTLNELPEVG